MRTVVAAPSGALGFDTDTKLTAKSAQAFVAAGYQFVVRYLTRGTSEYEGDLTEDETDLILDSGLALMAVQHPSEPGWLPTEELGESWGQYAAGVARAVGLPAGVTIWLDLEEVGPTSTSVEVEEFCNAWFAAVTVGGYRTGLYVGAGCGLDATRLYRGLSTQRYWKSGSDVPDVDQRGYCMVQEIGDPPFSLSGVTNDVDTIQHDLFGDTPYWLIDSEATAYLHVRDRQLKQAAEKCSPKPPPSPKPSDPPDPPGSGMGDPQDPPQPGQ